MFAGCGFRIFLGDFLPFELDCVLFCICGLLLNYGWCTIALLFLYRYCVLRNCVVCWNFVDLRLLLLDS